MIFIQKCLSRDLYVHVKYRVQYKSILFDKTNQAFVSFILNIISMQKIPKNAKKGHFRPILANLLHQKAYRGLF